MKNFKARIRLDKDYEFSQVEIPVTFLLIQISLTLNLIHSLDY